MYTQPIPRTSQIFSNEHLILQKSQQLEHALATQTLQNQHKEELERLDDLQIQGMIQAKQKCQKLHTRPCRWTPELTRMMTELHYWQLALHQAEGRPYHARFLWQLARALELPINPTNDTGDNIKIWLKTLKEKLKKKLGDSNRWEKWLEGLATAQTAETRGDWAKQLRHLMHTEEQRLHTQQIHCTNQMARVTSGLSAVSIAHLDGTTTHHLDKNSMEAACLEEAWV